MVALLTLRRFSSKKLIVIEGTAILYRPGRMPLPTRVDHRTAPSASGSSAQITPDF